MDILFLINSNLKFKTVAKDRLFYDLYQYSVSFHLDEVSCLRELNHTYINTVIERRKVWREVAQQRWVNNKQLGNGMLTRRSKDITEETVTNLHDLTDILLRSRVDFKLVTSMSTAWIYTNDMTLLNKIDETNFLMWKMYGQAKVDRPKNTIRLKNPRHLHRGYFKNLKLTDQEKTQLTNFFVNQGTAIRVSPALLTWTKQNFQRTEDYFFIDYNEESWLTMLSLVRPGLIRKTVDLIAD